MEPTSDLYVGQGPTEFDTLDEVAGSWREPYAPLAAASEETIAEWIKGSIPPPARGTLMWKMDPSVWIELLRRGSIATFPISGFPTRACRSRR